MIVINDSVSLKNEKLKFTSNNMRAYKISMTTWTFREPWILLNLVKFTCIRYVPSINISLPETASVLKRL